MASKILSHPIGLTIGLIATVIIVLFLAAIGASFFAHQNNNRTNAVPSSSTQHTLINANSQSSYITSFRSVSGLPSPRVQLSGIVATTGQGTRAISISFSGKSGNFTYAISDHNFNASLPNLQTYGVNIKWVGNYSWQKGSYNTQYSVDQKEESGTAVAVTNEDWSIPTPNSQIFVAGGASTTGNETKATEISFTSSKAGNFVARVIGGRYSLFLPNGLNYSVSVSWSGAFSWQ